MIYNYYTGSPTPVPTITAILPADVTVTVGAYSSGYFPLTISADCQFVINMTGFTPVPMQVETGTTTALADISSRLPAALVEGRMSSTVSGTTVVLSAGTHTGAVIPSVTNVTNSVDHISEPVSLSPGTINQYTFAAGAITASAFAPNSIVSSALAAGALSGQTVSYCSSVGQVSTLGAGAIQAATLGTNALASQSIYHCDDVGYVDSVDSVSSVSYVSYCSSVGTVSSATIYSLPNGIISAGTFAAGAIDAAALAANAITKITSAVAPASTALSSAVWTAAKAGYLDAAITSRQASGATGSVTVSGYTLGATPLLSGDARLNTLTNLDATVSSRMPSGSISVGSVNVSSMDQAVIDTISTSGEGAAFTGSVTVSAIGNVDVSTITSLDVFREESSPQSVSRRR